jgi:hypothetical protein
MILARLQVRVSEPRNRLPALTTRASIGAVSRERHTLFDREQGLLLILPAWCATSAERERVVPTSKAKSALRGACLSPLGEGHRDLVAIYNLLREDDSSRVRDRGRDFFVRQILGAVERGNLLVLLGQPTGKAAASSSGKREQSREVQIAARVMDGRGFVSFEGSHYRALPAIEWTSFESRDHYQVVRVAEARILLRGMAASLVGSTERKAAFQEAEALVSDSSPRSGGLFLLRPAPIPTLDARPTQPAVTPAQLISMSVAAPKEKQPKSKEGPYPIIVTAQGQRMSRAWIYLNDGSTTLYRTDAQGVVRVGGARTAEGYDRLVKTAVPKTVRLYYSRATLPLPDAVVKEAQGQFWERTLEPAAVKSEDVPIKVGEAAIEAEAVFVDLPVPPLTISTPKELALWPITFEVPTEDYETAGLPQGDAFWVQNHVREGAAAAGAPSADVPKLRPLEVTGQLRASGSSVEVRVYDEKGDALPLRSQPTDQAETPAIQLALAAGTTAFRLKLYPAQPAQAFGLVQPVVTIKSATPALPVDCVCQLVGLQMGLVDDGEAALAGAQPGPIHNESNDKVVVDFTSSPGTGADDATARAQLTQQTRVRRMTVFPIRATRVRPRLGVASPIVQAEMPLWMLELQVLGMAKPDLQRLMELRTKSSAPDIVSRDSLTVAARFGLRMSWDAPDSAYPRPRYTFANQDQTFRSYQGSNGWIEEAVTFTVALQGGQLTAPSAWAEPARAAVPFPVTGRRAPTILVDGQQRGWGRQAGAPQVNALVFEHQPAIINSDAREIIRGANGVVFVESLSIDAEPIAPQPGEAHNLRTPSFRMVGENPARALSDAVVEAYVRATFATNTAEIQMLAVEVWLDLCHRLAGHESGFKQYEDRSSGRYRFAENLARVGIADPVSFHGFERGTPKFGAPSGFGYGQHDPPRSIDDMWDPVENIRQTVNIIMVSKAHDAYHHLSRLNALDPASRHDRAVFRREVTRAYNGGTEFIWQGHAWHMRPSVGGARLAYCNRALGTNVVYDNAAPPILTPANYGPLL